jgi:4-hydroxybenzoyl-CoA thioesterase
LRVHVRFGDCDPAGIVYFPRFFDFFHQAMETWFSAIGAPYADVIGVRRLGFPAVHTHADFRAPTRFGEAIDVELRVAELGHTSIRFAYDVRAPGDAHPRVMGETVCVVMDLAPESPTHRRAIPMPEDLRARVEQWRGG